MSESETTVRGDWWHIILFMPVAVIIGGLIGGVIGFLLMGFTALVYPVALYKDTKWVNAKESPWTPGTKRYIFVGVLVMLSFGILSLIVSPYYLYKRRQLG